MDEIWKEIPGTDYSVSNMGRVASRKRGEWRVMRLSVNKGGYLQIALRVNGTMRTRKVHQLIAEVFIGPRPTPAHQVNHKNGIKTDNRAVNLEWATGSENVRHSFDVLGHVGPRGERQGNVKLTEANVHEIRARWGAGESQTSIATDLGIDQTTVSLIVLRKSWAWLGLHG